MFYDPPKTKRYILIGAIAIVLAVLAIYAIPLLYKNKTTQTKENLPVTSQQQKIQKEFDKLGAMRKSTNATPPTQEEIQKEFDALEKQKAESNAIPPTQEQIQAEFLKLEKMKK